MDKERIHDKIRDEIKKWLESKNCVVHSRIEIELPLSSLNRNDWYHLLDHGKLPKYRLPSGNLISIYKPSLRKTILIRQRKYVIVDLLGFKEKMTNNFIIEFSRFSNLTKEVKKLKEIYKIKTKVIVTTDDTEGEREVNGIRIIPYKKFKPWFEGFFLLDE